MLQDDPGSKRIRRVFGAFGDRAFFGKHRVGHHLLCKKKAESQQNEYFQYFHHYQRIFLREELVPTFAIRQQLISPTTTTAHCTINCFHFSH